MFWRFLRKYFLTGILVLLPLIITGYILIFAFNLVDGILRDLIQLLTGRDLPGVGFLIMIGLVLLAGLFGTNVVGRRLIAWGEEILRRIPVVKSIYTATKQVMEAFALQRREVFQRVVLLEYPRRGLFSLGFITGEAPAEITGRVKKELLNVYLPATPPTAGVFLIAPREELIFLEMSVEEGLKLLVSGGIITSAPSYQNAHRAPVGDERDLPVYFRRSRKTR
ncbi:MAG: DUF502 domain-containing protein [Bacillota bacterium]|nr:DUF502 domain-containing protein [Bacillota bacterium]